MRRALLLSTFVLLLIGQAGPVRADTVELRNGRRIEGRVLARGKLIKIEVLGGTLEIPSDAIASIEVGPTPQDEYGTRLLTLNLEDPEAVERLAQWAKSKSLEVQARQLEAIARGVRLDRKVQDARRARDPRIFLGVASWAQASGCSREVRRYLVEQALKLDPRSRDARSMLSQLEVEEQSEPTTPDSERADKPAPTTKEEETYAAKTAPSSRGETAQLARAEAEANAKREREELERRIEELREEEERKTADARRWRRRAAAAAKRDGPFELTPSPDAPWILVPRPVAPQPGAGAPPSGGPDRAAWRSSSR